MWGSTGNATVILEIPETSRLHHCSVAWKFIKTGATEKYFWTFLMFELLWELSSQHDEKVTSLEWVDDAFLLIDH